MTSLDSAPGAAGPKSSAELFLHRLAARTGLASAAQTRTQTDDGTYAGASQGHDEDDAGEETQLTIRTMRSPAPLAGRQKDAMMKTLMTMMRRRCSRQDLLARRCQRDPSCSYKRQAKTPCNKQLYICVDYMLVF